MDWVLVILGTCAAVEAFVRLRFTAQVRGLSVLLPKITNTLRSARISDHWKEKVLAVYAGRLLKLSLKLFLMIAIILLPVAAACMVGAVIGAPALARFSSLSGILVSVFVAVGYMNLRQRIKA